MISSYVNACLAMAWDAFPKAVMRINDKTIEAVIDAPDEYDNKDIGGYDLMDTLVLLVKTADLGSYSRGQLIGAAVTVDGREWRITRIRKGEVATTIELEDVKH